MGLFCALFLKYVFSGEIIENVAKKCLFHICIAKVFLI